MSVPWWKKAVIYQIYPRSFMDTNGDGIGDLEGIRRRLDYLAWLGVDGVWLSPVYPSPMADFGYDVADYCAIHPSFGTLAEFERLLAEAHQRGLKVLLDWVPNHSSDQHPWFLESRSSRHNPKRNWYFWRDRPNNWKAAFGGDAWSFDPRTRQWFLHSYLPQQPDLNWRNPEVAEAMLERLRFWLERGVDGFRVDAVHRLAKDPELRDNPPHPDATAETREYHTQLHRYDQDHPDVHPLLRRVRALVDSYPGDRLLVGEVYLLTTSEIAPYYGQGDEFQLAFLFPLLRAPWDAGAWRRCLEEVAQVFEPLGAWPGWALSNHDHPRQRTRYGSEARARAAAVALMTLPGTPFVYAGEELGLEDAAVPAERAVDPGGRDGCRAPIPWDGSPTHGWATAEAWLPWPPNADRIHAEALRTDEGSILHLYRRLLAARRACPALQLGRWTPLDSPEGTLVYERSTGEERRLVLINFQPDSARVGVDGHWQVEIASDGQGEGQPYAGEVRGECGLVLAPA